MRRIFWTAFAIMLCRGIYVADKRASEVWAAQAPITQEPRGERFYTVYSASFTSQTAINYDIAAMMGTGYYAGQGISQSSAPWQNFYGFSYAIYGLGGGGQFQIAQTTATYAKGAYLPTGFNNQAPFGLAGSSTSTVKIPAISTSPAIFFPTAVAYNGTFQVQLLNPVFIFSNLSSASTYWMTVEGSMQNQP